MRKNTARPYTPDADTHERASPYPEGRLKKIWAEYVCLGRIWYFAAMGSKKRTGYGFCPYPAVFLRTALVYPVQHAWAEFFLPVYG